MVQGSPSHVGLISKAFGHLPKRNPGPGSDMGINDRVCVRHIRRSGAKPFAKARHHAAVPSKVISSLLKKGPVFRLVSCFLKEFSLSCN